MHWSRGYCFNDWWKWEWNINVWLLGGFFYNLILFIILLLLLLFYSCYGGIQVHAQILHRSIISHTENLPLELEIWFKQLQNHEYFKRQACYCWKLTFQELYGLYTVYLCLESTASIKFNYFPVQLYIEGDFKTRAAAIKFNYFPLRLA